MSAEVVELAIRRTISKLRDRSVTGGYLNTDVVDAFENVAHEIGTMLRSFDPREQPPIAENVDAPAPPAMAVDDAVVVARAAVNLLNQALDAANSKGLRINILEASRVDKINPAYVIGECVKS